MARKPKFALVGPTPAQLARGEVLPSIHQVLSDAQTALADEMANLASLREASEMGEAEDLERSATLTKNALARMDALKKGLQIAALIREEKAAAQRERIAGMDRSQMSDEQVRELLAGSLSAPAQKPQDDE